MKIKIQSINEGGECWDPYDFDISPFTGNPTEELICKAYDKLIKFFKEEGETVNERDMSFLEDGILGCKVSEAYFVDGCFVDNHLYPTRFPEFIGSRIHLIDVVGEVDDVSSLVSKIKKVVKDLNPKLDYWTRGSSVYKVSKDIDISELVKTSDISGFKLKVEAIEHKLSEIGKLRS